jgi:hypothetical protein
MEVSLVPVEYIEQVWPSIESYLQGAADYSYGRYTVEDIKEGLITKPQSLWIAFEDKKVLGAVVTAFTYYPSMTALDMVFTGGIELQRWKTPMLDILQRYAKDNGCKIIESYGRAGWERIFKQDGFKKRFMFYELPVEKE